MWTEWQARAIPTPEGPMLAQEGQVVIVVVANSLGEAMKQMATLRPEAPGDKQG